MTNFEYWQRRARAWWVQKVLMNRVYNLRLDMDYFLKWRGGL